MNINKTITLPLYDIVVELGDLDSNSTEAYLGGTITSSLKEDGQNSNLYELAMNVVESMILSCACAGIDIESPAFVEAIETTIDKIQNDLDLC